MDVGEAKRRIEAARILRSMTQVELDRRGAAMGLDKQELSRTERGTLDLTPARAMVLCEILRVPPRWFDDEDLDNVMGLNDQRAGDALDLLQQALTDLGLAQPPSTEAAPEGAPGTGRASRSTGAADA